MITRRAVLTGMGATLAAGMTGCARGGPDLKPGYRPDIKTDEAGLWLQSDLSEADTRADGNRIRHPALTELLEDMVCRLAPKHCPQLRVYVVRTGVANASASPNGMLQVWTGLLVRMKTESELAAILGHEIAHFIRRHSLMRMRNRRSKTDFAAFFGLGLAATGGSQLSKEILDLIVTGNISVFSRSNEREADALGLTYMADAGYDPYACGAVWRRFMELRKASEEGEEEDFDFFLSTHPPDKERAEKLAKLAKKRKKTEINAPNRLRAVLAPIRGQLLADEVNQGHFKQSSKLFDILLEDDPAPGQILYHKGELHRRRAKEGDDALALGYYHEACEAAGSPPEAYRMVGLIRWRRGEKQPAREYFRRYLDKMPDAPDRAMIQSYLAGV